MEKKQNTLINKLFSNEISEISYRKDINFLRAVAIISVLIYHFDKNLFPGGWLGVDGFFFISGYLIVNKIIIGFSTKDIFLKFIKKRFTRLAPSLASMIIATSVFYYFF